MGGLVAVLTREGAEVCLSAPASRAHVMPQYMCPGEGGRTKQKAHRGRGVVDDEEEVLGGVEGAMVTGGVA